MDIHKLRSFDYEEEFFVYNNNIFFVMVTGSTYENEDVLNSNQIQSMNEDETILIASELSKRINEYSENELCSIISDENNDSFFRITLIQLYSRMFASKTVAGNQSLRTLLLDDKTNSEIKQNIVIGIENMNQEAVELLEELSYSSDDLLAFQAIKKLNKIDHDKAVVLAADILSDYKNETPERVSASLNVMSMEYRRARIKNMDTDGLRQQKQVFIEICADLIHSSIQKDDILKDSAIFALADMTDADAMTEIIQNSKIEDFMKLSAINQNFLTLRDMLQKDGSLEAITTVCKAMEIYPIQELSEPLLEAKKTFEMKSSNDMSLDISRVAAKVDQARVKIQEEGRPADDSYYDFYYGSDIRD